MILKASQRNGGQHLAAYLLHTSQNEHIELYDLRGFASDGDLAEAFAEIEAQAQGTRCEKMFFSVSFNPPPDEDVNTGQFEAAFAKVEEKFGLKNQPRAVVFHEKKGRRHGHVVWGLIDTEKNRAIKLKLYKRTLQTISRELYLEHGWTMPGGMQKGKKGHADNYTMAEKHQAERAGFDPKQFKKMLREMIDGSDSRQVFESVLAEKGLYLARGDKRPFCVVDAIGEVHNLIKQTGYKKEEIEKRLGSPETLPSVEQVLGVIKERVVAVRLKKAIADLRQHQARERNLYHKQLAEMTVQHRNQRETLRRQQWRRTVEEERSRGDRLRGGIIRLFDGITRLKDRLLGRAAGTQKRIGQEREQSRRRDLGEKDELNKQQRQERRQLKYGLLELEQRHEQTHDKGRERTIEPPRPKI